MRTFVVVFRHLFQLMVRETEAPVFLVIRVRWGSALLSGVTIGSTLPQSDRRNLALNVLSIVMLMGLPCMLPVTVVWLVPVMLSVPDN